MDSFSDMGEGLHKAKSGLIRALVRVEDGLIKDLIISGDYILTPEHYVDEMEKALIGVEASWEKVLEKLRAFYAANKGRFYSPQTFPEDFAEAVMKAAADYLKSVK